MKKNLFCADIGGTNSRFVHVLYNEGEVQLGSIGVYATSQFRNMQELLQTAQKATGVNLARVDAQVWGIAGPVQQENVHKAMQGQLTNGTLCLDFSSYDWASQGDHFYLVNDFALQAFASFAPQVPVSGVLGADGENASTNKNTTYVHKSTGPRAFVGAGTGLGAAALLPPFAINDANVGWTLMPSEVGHTALFMRGAEEEDFARYVLNKLQQDYLSAEDILSGGGLSLLHGYVHGQNLSPSEVAKSMTKAHEQGVKNPVLALYARFLGRFCRQWALSTLCTGGLFLTGGVLMKNPYIVQQDCFKEEFYAVPTSMQPILQNIPVWLMQHEHVGLWGAAYLAKNALTKKS